ncbi:MAG: GntR family transcriptional regulator [Proteobacteria bacterium]|nr:GntR family transcriptional regulator [Pseudomonadota bacterium]
MPLADWLWQDIVSDIARGRLKPGQWLRESFLEQAYDTSRVSVREALRTLQAQGIVVKVPHSGCRVMEVDDAMAREVFRARLEIEKLAVADLLNMIESGNIELTALEAAIEHMDDAATAGDAALFEQADLGFHRDICQLSGNRTASLLWQTLWPHVRIARGLIESRAVNFNSLMQEHVELLHMLRTADRTALFDAWGDHLFKHIL